MKRLIPLFLVISLAAWPLIAESTWQGTTAVGRYGEFPARGNYGASDSFAVNTTVTVKNLDNGKETTVIIVDRLNNPGLFLLVSTDAAQALGIPTGEISRVQASISQPEGTTSTFPEDLPFNPDPDVNPAVSASTADRNTQIPVSPAHPVETALVAETGEAAAVSETVETALVAETGEAAAVSETAETALVAATDETGETVEVAETATIDDSPPKINGVDIVSPPPEEQPPSEAADEPSPPVEIEDTVAVSALSSADDAVDTEPRLIVEKPVEPSVDQDETPSVLGLMPAPVLDETEKFVLLAEPDTPDVSEIVDTREPALEEALRISSLSEPSVLKDEVIEEITPAEPVEPVEPVFEEPVVMEEEPAAEDILIVSDLIEPTAVAEIPGDLPSIADEPEVIEGTIADGPELRYSLLGEPGIPALDDAAVVAGHGPTLESARVTLIDDPAESGVEGIAELELDEPLFIALEEGPSEYEDILIVTDLNTPADPGESVETIAMTGRDEPAIRETPKEELEDTPVVVNGITPPAYDPDQIEIVLEPAEPRPPEPRIAGSDLLANPEGDEPETDVEVAAVSEPGVPVTKIAVAEEIPKTKIAVEEAAKPEVKPEIKPEVREETVAVVSTETEKPLSTAPAEAPSYTTELSRESFYLQIAAFSEAKAAAKLKDALSDTYPVTVYLTESAERPVYKVLVGPLNRDESGALLYRFKVRGFPDAFVRAGTVN